MDRLSLFLVPALVALLAATAARGTTADDDIGLLATQIGESTRAALAYNVTSRCDNVTRR